MRTSPNTGPHPRPRRPVSLAKARDEAAFTLVIARAVESGFLDRMRGLPPATVDRIAAAAGWERGPTRAVLQALAACGLVDYDTDLSTWSLAVDATECTTAVEAVAGLLEVSRALLAEGPMPEPRLGPPEELFEERLLPADPELRSNLENGGLVVDLCGGGRMLPWLQARFPRIRTMRLEEPPAVGPVALAMSMCPMHRPNHPEIWFEQVARILGSSGRLLVRVLGRSLEPPDSLDQGWWHAFALAAALKGGRGNAWSESLLRRAAAATGSVVTHGFACPRDPACVYLVVRSGSSLESIRLR